MNLKNWILDRLPPNILLIVIVGEAHNLPSHNAFLQALLTSCIAQQNQDPSKSFALGHEKQCNFREWAHQEFKLGLSEQTLTAPDLDGRIALETFLNAPDHSYSPLSKKALAKLCLEHHISTSFNDLANVSKRHENGLAYAIIDQSDEATQAIVKKYAPEHPAEKEITRYSQDEMDDLSLGITLSNRSMVENALAHINRTKSRFYLQSCGLKHQDELSHFFQEAGCAVLNVACNDNTIVLEDVTNRPGWSIEIQNMNDDICNNHRSVFYEPEDVTRRQINDASGGILEPYV